MTGVEIAMGVAAVAAVAASAVSTASAIQESDAQAAAAKDAAKQRREAAAAEERRVRLQTARTAAAQRAAYAASGVSIEGSPLQVLEDTASQGELDALYARYGGEVGAWQANAARAQALTRRRSALIGGSLQTVGAASKAYGVYAGSAPTGEISGGVGTNYAGGGSAGDTLSD